jgi:hypothetical protein
MTGSSGSGSAGERHVLAAGDTSRRPRGDRCVDDVVCCDQAGIEVLRNLDSRAMQKAKPLALPVPRSLRERQRLAGQHRERHLRMHLPHARVVDAIDVQDGSPQGPSLS